MIVDFARKETTFFTRMIAYPPPSWAVDVAAQREPAITPLQAEAFYFSVIDHIKWVQLAAYELDVDRDQWMYHDASKFDRVEFNGYARNFVGADGKARSHGDPVAFAPAWLHHIHCNPHHWQHWIFPNGFTPKDANVEAGGVVEMPDHYVVEMVADWLGASRAYTGHWDMSKWLKDNLPRVMLHTKSAETCRLILDQLGYDQITREIPFKHEAIPL